MAPARSRSRTKETSRRRKKSESSGSGSSGSGSSRSSSQSSSSSGSSGSSSSTGSRSRSRSASASRSRSRSRSASSSSSSSRSTVSGGDRRRSPVAKRDRKSPLSPPKASKIHVGRLTKNVTKDHVLEIFSMYGPIRSVDMPPDRIHPHLSRGFAYVDFEKSEDAEKAIKYMDGGQIDGQEITASLVYTQKPRPYGGGPPMRRGGGGPPNWGRRSIPRRNRRNSHSRSPPRYRRSPRKSRSRSRTPPRKRRDSSSRSSSR